MTQMVYVVKKNADFTEGRGPMMFHKVFVDEETAVDYIMDQDGVFGSPQCEQTSRYARGGCRAFNGYALEPAPVVTRDDLEKFAYLQEELNQLDVTIESATERAKAIRKILS